MSEDTHDVEQRALLEEHRARLAALPPLTTKAVGPLTNDAIRRINADNAAHVEGVLRSSRIYAKAVTELHSRRMKEE